MIASQEDCVANQPLDFGQGLTKNRGQMVGMEKEIISAVHRKMYETAGSGIRISFVVAVNHKKRIGPTTLLFGEIEQ